MGWYSGVEYEYYTYMSVGAATGQYWWAFWALILCNILIPAMLWFRPIRTSFFWAWAIAIVINVGMWFERFDIIVLCLHREYLPSGWTMFYPTWVDVGTFLGTIGGVTVNDIYVLIEQWVGVAGGELIYGRIALLHYSTVDLGFATLARFLFARDK